MAKKVRTDTPKGRCVGCHQKASRPRRSTCSQACAGRMRRALSRTLDQLADMSGASRKSLLRERKVLEGLVL